MSKQVPLRYVPSSLTKRDREKQKRALRKSRRLYKKGVYFTRPTVGSFPHKKSNHILNAERMYKIPNVSVNDTLARKTGCSKEALSAIVRKGEGAYYSSGSRPNQTPQSWGLARLASAITSGNAAAVDYSILEKGCNKKSRALKGAKKALSKKKSFKKRQTKKIRFI